MILWVFQLVDVSNISLSLVMKPLLLELIILFLVLDQNGVTGSSSAPQISRATLSLHLDRPSLTERQNFNDDPITSLWESSFPSTLPLANKQTYAEAKHIFYGKNTWVMVASVQRTYNTLPPTAAVPYVRTALSRIYRVAGHLFRGTRNRDRLA